MRLSAHILQSAEQRTNPIGDREIILRSLAIPSIEHLAVTRDQFDTMDLSNNHISRLENFPRLDRLTCLYLGGNSINYVDGKNLKRNVPNLTTVILSGNGVKGWNVIGDLGSGCPKLEFLSLVGNPVTSKWNVGLSVLPFFLESLGRVWVGCESGGEGQLVCDFDCINFNYCAPTHPFVFIYFPSSPCCLNLCFCTEQPMTSLE